MSHNTRCRLCFMLTLTILSSFYLCGCVRDNRTQLTSEMYTEETENIASTIDEQELTQISESDSFEVYEDVDSTTDIENIYCVHLELDWDILQQMADDWITSRHEAADRNDLDYWGWVGSDSGTPMAYLSCDSLGTVNFIDATLDRTGIYEDFEKLVEFGYFTENKPNGLDISSMDASRECSETMMQYSGDIKLIPYRAIAVNVDDLSGYYSVYLQGYYEGIPIALVSNVGDNRIWGCVNICDEGIFEFTGFFTLKETAKEKIESIISAKDVLANFSESSSILTGGEFEFEGMELQYFCSSTDDETYLLEPVWAINGTVHQEYDNLDSDIQVCVLYYAESGVLCDVYYPGF